MSADRTDLPSQVREAMLRKRFPLLGLKSSEHSPCSQKGRPKASRGRGEKNSWSRSGAWIVAACKLDWLIYIAMSKSVGAIDQVKM